jgi:plasmid stability protein
MADYIIRGMPDELHKKAKIRAVEEGITLKDLILKAVKQYLKKKGR